MKTKLMFSLSVVFAAVGSLIACGGGGEDSSSGSSLLERSTVVELPKTLGDKSCVPRLLNNNAEVLFSCGADGSKDRSYAMWKGGEALEPLGFKFPSSEYVITHLADNGNMNGVINKYTTQVNSDNELEIIGSAVQESFVVINGKLQLFEDALSLSMSDDGTWLVDREQSGFRVFHNGVEQEKIPVPEGVSLLTVDSVSNRGEVVGVAVIASENHGFAAQRGFIQNNKELKLLPLPGRADLVEIGFLRVSNAGHILQNYLSDTISNVESAGERYTYQVLKSLLSDPDGRTREIGTGDAYLETFANLVNSNGVVTGRFQEWQAEVKASTENEAGWFIYSPKTGFKTFSDAAPSPESLTEVIDLNDKDEMLIKAGEDKYLLIKSTDLF